MNGLHYFEFHNTYDFVNVVSWVLRCRTMHISWGSFFLDRTSPSTSQILEMVFATFNFEKYYAFVNVNARVLVRFVLELEALVNLVKSSKETAIQMKWLPKTIWQVSAGRFVSNQSCGSKAAKITVQWPSHWTSNKYIFNRQKIYFTS